MKIIDSSMMQTLRSPTDQLEFAQAKWEEIYTNDRKRARVNDRRENEYKLYREEFLPFAHLCAEYFHSLPENAQCALAAENDNHDGEIRLNGELVQEVEFTLAIDGEAVNDEMKRLNRDGNVATVFAYDDTSKHEAVKSLVLKAAQKKAEKIYTTRRASSTLVIRADLSDFYSSNPHHELILNQMLDELSAIDYNVDAVVLMHFSMESKRYEYRVVKAMPLAQAS